MKPQDLQCVLVGPGMEEAKKTILADAETPAALLEADRAVNRTPFGAKGPEDVEIVPVEKMFE
jgi:hypothetical protein